MSLDVTLYVRVEPVGLQPGGGIFVREGGRTLELTREEWDRRYPGREPVVVTAPPTDEQGRYAVFSANITHNMVPMAKACGLHAPLWRPVESGYTKASDLVEPIAAGMRRLIEDPDAMSVHNPSNGWGNYDTLLGFARDYLAACQVYPDAEISVSV